MPLCFHKSYPPGISCTSISAVGPMLLLLRGGDGGDISPGACSLLVRVRRRRPPSRYSSKAFHFGSKSADLMCVSSKAFPTCRKRPVIKRGLANGGHTSKGSGPVGGFLFLSVTLVILL